MQHSTPSCIWQASLRSGSPPPPSATSRRRWSLSTAPPRPTRDRTPPAQSAHTRSLSRAHTPDPSAQRTHQTPQHSAHTRPLSAPRPPRRKWHSPAHCTPQPCAHTRPLSAPRPPRRKWQSPAPPLPGCDRGGAGSDQSWVVSTDGDERSGSACTAGGDHSNVGHDRTGSSAAAAAAVAGASALAYSGSNAGGDNAGAVAGGDGAGVPAHGAGMAASAAGMPAGLPGWFATGTAPAGLGFPAPEDVEAPGGPASGTPSAALPGPRDMEALRAAPSAGLPGPEGVGLAPGTKSAGIPDPENAGLESGMPFAALPAHEDMVALRAAGPPGPGNVGLESGMPFAGSPCPEIGGALRAAPGKARYDDQGQQQQKQQQQQQQEGGMEPSGSGCDSPQSVVGSCCVPASDGYLTSPGSGIYASSPETSHSQPHVTLHSEFSPDTAGSAMRVRVGERGGHERACSGARRSATHDPDHLFANPMFTDRVEPSSPIRPIPFQHSTALQPPQFTPSQARYPGSPTSGLSTPHPNGHSDPYYYNTRAATSLRRHSNAAAGCFLGVGEAQASLFSLHDSSELGEGGNDDAIRVRRDAASLGLFASKGALPSGLSGEHPASHSFWFDGIAAPLGQGCGKEPLGFPPLFVRGAFDNAACVAAGRIGSCAGSPDNSTSSPGVAVRGESMSPSGVTVAATPRAIISSLQGSLSLANSHASTQNDHGSGNSGSYATAAEASGADRPAAQATSPREASGLAHHPPHEAPPPMRAQQHAEGDAHQDLVLRAASAPASATAISGARARVHTGLVPAAPVPATAPSGAGACVHAGLVPAASAIATATSGAEACMHAGIVPAAQAPATKTSRAEACAHAGLVSPLIRGIDASLQGFLNQHGEQQAGTAHARTTAAAAAHKRKAPGWRAQRQRQRQKRPVVLGTCSSSSSEWDSWSGGSEKEREVSAGGSRGGSSWGTSGPVDPTHSSGSRGRATAVATEAGGYAATEQGGITSEFCQDLPASISGSANGSGAGCPHASGCALPSHSLPASATLPPECTPRHSIRSLCCSDSTSGPQQQQQQQQCQRHGLLGVQGSATTACAALGACAAVPQAEVSCGTHGTGLAAAMDAAAADDEGGSTVHNAHSGVHVTAHSGAHTTPSALHTMHSSPAAVNLALLLSCSSSSGGPTPRHIIQGLLSSSEAHNETSSASPATATSFGGDGWGAGERPTPRHIIHGLLSSSEAQKEAATAPPAASSSAPNEAGTASLAVATNSGGSGGGEGLAPGLTCGGAAAPDVRRRAGGGDTSEVGGDGSEGSLERSKAAPVGSTASCVRTLSWGGAAEHAGAECAGAQADRIAGGGALCGASARSSVHERDADVACAAAGCNKNSRMEGVAPNVAPDWAVASAAHGVVPCGATARSAANEAAANGASAGAAASAGEQGPIGFGSCMGSLGSACEGEGEVLNSAATSALLPLPSSSSVWAACGPPCNHASQSEGGLSDGAPGASTLSSMRAAHWQHHTQGDSAPQKGWHAAMPGEPLATLQPQQRPLQQNQYQQPQQQQQQQQQNQFQQPKQHNQHQPQLQQQQRRRRLWYEQGDAPKAGGGSGDPQPSQTNCNAECGGNVTDTDVGGDQTPRKQLQQQQQQLPRGGNGEDAKASSAGTHKVAARGMLPVSLSPCKHARSRSGTSMGAAADVGDQAPSEVHPPDVGDRAPSEAHPMAPSEADPMGAAADEGNQAPSEAPCKHARSRGSTSISAAAYSGNQAPSEMHSCNRVGVAADVGNQAPSKPHPDNTPPACVTLGAAPAAAAVEQGRVEAASCAPAQQGPQAPPSSCLPVHTAATNSSSGSSGSSNSCSRHAMPKSSQRSATSSSFWLGGLLAASFVVLLMLSSCAFLMSGSHRHSAWPQHVHEPATAWIPLSNSGPPSSSQQAQHRTLHLPQHHHRAAAPPGQPLDLAVPPPSTQLPHHNAQPLSHTAQLPHQNAQPLSHTAQLPRHNAQPLSHTAQLPHHNAQPLSHTAQLPRHNAQPLSHTAQLPHHNAQPLSHTAQLPHLETQLLAQKAYPPTEEHTLWVCPAQPLLQVGLVHAILDPSSQLPPLCYAGVDADALVNTMMLQDLRFQQALWAAAQNRALQAQQARSAQPATSPGEQGITQEEVPEGVITNLGSKTAGADANAVSAVQQRLPASDGNFGIGPAQRMVDTAAHLGSKTAGADADFAVGVQRTLAASDTNRMEPVQKMANTAATDSTARRTVAAAATAIEQGKATEADLAEGLDPTAVAEAGAPSSQLALEDPVEASAAQIPAETDPHSQAATDAGSLAAADAQGLASADAHSLTADAHSLEGAGKPAGCLAAAGAQSLAATDAHSLTAADAQSLGVADAHSLTAADAHSLEEGGKPAASLTTADPLSPEEADTQSLAAADAQSLSAADPHSLEGEGKPATSLTTADAQSPEEADAHSQEAAGKPAASLAAAGAQSLAVTDAHSLTAADAHSLAATSSNAHNPAATGAQSLAAADAPAGSLAAAGAQSLAATDAQSLAMTDAHSLAAADAQSLAAADAQIVAAASAHNLAAADTHILAAGDAHSQEGADAQSLATLSSTKTTQPASTEELAAAKQPASTGQPASGAQPRSAIQPASAAQPASGAQPRSAIQPASAAQPASGAQPRSAIQPASAAQPASGAQPAAATQPVSIAQPGLSTQHASATQPAAQDIASDPTLPMGLLESQQQQQQQQQAQLEDLDGGSMTQQIQQSGMAQQGQQQAQLDGLNGGSMTQHNHQSGMARQAQQQPQSVSLNGSGMTQHTASKGQGLHLVVVACLLVAAACVLIQTGRASISRTHTLPSLQHAAHAAAVTSMLTQTGRASMSRTRMLPSLQHAAHAAWYAARLTSAAACMLYRATADAALACAAALTSSDTAHQLRLHSWCTAAAVQGVGPVLARLARDMCSMCSMPARARQHSWRARRARASWPHHASVRGTQPQPLAVRVAAALGTAAGLTARYILQLCRVCAVTWRSAWGRLQGASGSCVEAAPTAGPQLQVSARCVARAGCAGARLAWGAALRVCQFAVCMGSAARPHLSSATDAALHTAAAVVVAMGLGGEHEGDGDHGDGDGPAAGARPAGGGMGRVLRLRDGAAMRQTAATTPGTVTRTPRSRFARRTPRSNHEQDEEKEHALYQQQQHNAREAAIHASEREALLGRTAAAAAASADDLLGSVSSDHMWLRGRLVLRQPPSTVSRQRRREEHNNL
ncbi:hypothetical protein DUNSADRAFT_15525 [Dunaliella salina]|uniref:Protein kinase domain-containing protein n=1 Tax=Dunaliella salina TaxID=3046 RepID=A0ABQ7G592_DUNSA|nr:hypothetical protein DUNSADRAFT_15525 [Dunaliella salina]|eukprot:KAF5829779.1 hypothetical protein DUNSADRAFT_15525 [Dunaliella salina]